jgi:predicted O-methyltransferase YrrM
MRACAITTPCRAAARAKADGRGERIRTSGIQLPKLALYLAELRPGSVAVGKNRAGLYRGGSKSARKGANPMPFPPVAKGPVMPRSAVSIEDYIAAHSLREPPPLAALRRENESRPRFNMQFTPESAQLFAMLLKLMGATRGIEVGTFTGYSGLAVALALPPEGKLICCDVSEEYTAVARRHWEKAGVAQKIELRLGPASATLDRLIAAGGTGQFDFMLIDADKTGYDGYYERALVLLRANGLIAIDNVLWGGAVAEPSGGGADTRALRALNGKIAKDERVDVSMLPLGDGLTLARKR